jgi:uncharacterized protein YndB with AHSA1/START domain
MRIDLATEIAAPPERVFVLLADVMAWPKNIDAIEHVEVLTPGPVGRGTRFRETRRMHGRSATEEMTIDAFDPPHHLRFTAENHGTRYVITHTVEPAPGGSRLSVVFEAMPVSLLARTFAAVARLMRRPLEKAIRGDLEDVKAAAEGKRIVVDEEV